MKHFRRNASGILLVLTAPLAQAELTVMDEAGLRETTGQAGVAVDLAANVEISEIAYKDEGYIFINDFQLGGAGIAQQALGEDISAGTALDNLRMTVDVAGPGDSVLSSAWGLAKLGGTALQPSSQNKGDHDVASIAIDDGDLVITPDAQDHAAGVDFGLLVDNIQLGRSGLAPGEGTTAGASLISGVKFKGMPGPVDIVVDQEQNSVNINAFFSLDGELKTDWYIPLLLNYKDMSLGLRLHNERGEDVLIYTANGVSQSYAHLQADIGTCS